MANICWFQLFCCYSIASNCSLVDAFMHAVAVGDICWASNASATAADARRCYCAAIPILTVHFKHAVAHALVCTIYTQLARQVTHVVHKQGFSLPSCTSSKQGLTDQPVEMITRSCFGVCDVLAIAGLKPLSVLRWSALLP